MTSAVSGKTTHLLRGRDAGQSKIDKAKTLGTTILDEDGFYNIVENSDGQKDTSVAKVEQVKKPAAKAASTLPGASKPIPASTTVPKPSIGEPT